MGTEAPRTPRIKTRHWSTLPYRDGATPEVINPGAINPGAPVKAGGPRAPYAPATTASCESGASGNVVPITIAA